MTVLRTSAALVALIVALVSPGAGVAGDLVVSEEPARVREPLAFTLGLVDRAPQQSRTVVAPIHSPADVVRRIPPPETIQALIDSTSTENMMATIQRLQDFESRYVVVDSCWAAGYWIEDRLRSYGYTDVRLDTFRTWTFRDSVDALNVIAYKEGATRPSEYVIFGGHYDSVTTDNFDDPDAPAPGAEDNATGVAAVLEAARILRDIEMERSVIFAFWSAEEVGLWGSRDFVAGAVDDSLDIVLYLNVDCIGLTPEGPRHGVVFSDSSALAVGALVSDIAHEYFGYEFGTRVRPLGASDQNSFWEAGFNVIDTAPDGSAPYVHTPNDVIDNVNWGMLRTVAATNIVATAAVAGIAGSDENLPPETTLVGNCAATHTVLTLSPRFEWEAVDFDGEIERYEYAIEQPDRGPPRQSGEEAAARSRTAATRSWIPLPADQTSITLTDLAEDTYQFLVRAIDDRGAADPTPASHIFDAERLFPEVIVATNFLPHERSFTERWTQDDETAVPVFENELLVFTLSADATSYCGTADSVGFALGDTASWSAWMESPYELVVRPDVSDSVVFVRARDENGSYTLGKIALAPVAALMDLPLLRVDDWRDPAVNDDTHDAFYEILLSGETHDVWDPVDHIVGGFPSLPPMEELGRYGTVLWTLDRVGGLLRAAQAESVYHTLEGYVRAGGNCILEGQSALATLGGRSEYTYRPVYQPGEFIYDHVGVDSLRNAGATSNPAWPNSYGYAFLGGLAVNPASLADVPVDTLGKWADTYETLGGVPYCEVVRPVSATARLYLFDSYLNPTLDEKPCATALFPVNGTGAFAYFGFPFYYLKTAPAVDMVEALLTTLRDWQEPSELLFFDWTAEQGGVDFAWYLDPPDEPTGCNIERKPGPRDSTGTYVRLNDELLRAGGTGRYAFLDDSAEPSGTYVYRLEVVEQSGRSTIHGPWEVDVPGTTPTDHLSRPYPNPTAGPVELTYGVTENHRWVSVTVYDVAGRLVRTLDERTAQIGSYEVVWDGTNRSGKPVASGIYFIRARIGNASHERKVVILR
jgi:hypothetical protein